MTKTISTVAIGVALAALALSALLALAPTSAYAARGVSELRAGNAFLSAGRGNNNGGAIAGSGGAGGSAGAGGLVVAGGAVSNAHAINMLNVVIVRISSR